MGRIIRSIVSQIAVVAILAGIAALLRGKPAGKGRSHSSRRRIGARPSGRSRTASHRKVARKARRRITAT
ncbi:MAG: hypothetical protein ABR562_07480 [Thermoplasmatota archaeon]